MVTTSGVPALTIAITPAAHADGDISKEESSLSSASAAESDANSFRLIYVMGFWESDEEDKRVSIAILMPSGLCARQKDYDVRVVADGRTLEVSFAWSREMTDTVYLHKYWLTKEPGFLPNHPRLIAFCAFLRRLRSNNQQEIHSTFRLKLPFKVKSELTITRRNTSYPRWVNSKEVVPYVTLEAPDANYLAEKESLPIFSSI
eukprot:IDg16567t1